MNEPHYLTNDIYLLGDTMYREGHQGSRPLTANNWHHHLKEYGWHKVPMPWIKELNLRMPHKLKNSPYGVLDCGAGGDCFFHCVAHALSERDYTHHTSDDIREYLCSRLTEQDFRSMIGFYRIMADADDFEEDWDRDPHDVETMDEFKEILLKGGNTYWGDYQLLTYLTTTMHLNVIILTHDEFDDEISVYNTLQDHNDTYDTIVLLYENQCHFKLIGHFNGHRMVSFFRGGDIPKELLEVGPIHT